MPEEALAAAAQVGYAVGGVEALAAPGAPGAAPAHPTRSEALEAALAAAVRVPDEQLRSARLAALAPLLPQILLPTALAAARSIEDRRAGTAALVRWRCRSPRRRASSSMPIGVIRCGRWRSAHGSICSAILSA